MTPGNGYQNRRLLGKRPPIPSSNKQAIAEALSDADAFIGFLGQLIAKKRQVKQGAMQELLTGRRRRPGSAGSGSSRPVRRKSCRFPLCGGSVDLPNSGFGKALYPVVFTRDYGHLSTLDCSSEAGPGTKFTVTASWSHLELVNTMSETHGFLACTIPSLWVTTFNSNDPKFVFYLYTSIGLERFATGSGVPTLNRNDVHVFKVRIPPATAEQAAIAAVLGDMDAGIAVLEAKLAKARQVKQGMMQELLTGRIRLV